MAPIRSICLAALVGSLITASTLQTRGAELVVNGEFSSGLASWTNSSLYFNGTPYVGGVAIVDDAPQVSALKLTGVVGTNYDVRVEQDILVDGIDGAVEVSFDWKVTVKESSWGVNYVVVDFHDAAEAIIGRIIQFDASNPNYTLEYFRNWLGGPPANAYYGVRRITEVFDWEHVFVTTAALPGLNTADIRRIRVRADVQNDATRGGELLVDNISIIGVPIVDCNDNGVEDSSDIAGGTSFDCLANGTPDECELAGDDCPYLRGDVNNDGDVDGNDVLQFTLVLLGLDECGCSVLAADMNGDGLVDARDIRPFRAVVRCHLGLPRGPSIPTDRVGTLLDLANEVGAPLDIGIMLTEPAARQLQK